MSLYNFIAKIIIIFVIKTRKAVFIAISFIHSSTLSYSAYNFIVSCLVKASSR